MNLQAQFDSSTNSAPSWFKATVNKVLGLLNSVFTNDVTSTLAFGWGEEHGSPINDPSSAAASQASGSFESYNTLKQGLANSPAHLAQNAAAAMPQQDPTSGGQFFVSSALQKSMGLANPHTTEVDGYVGVNAGLDWSTDQNLIGHGQYDLVGALEHEITEILGRTGSLSYGQGRGLYAPMDLFRYSAPGQRDLTPGAGNFSVLGKRMLQPFNNPTQGGDVADWLPSVQGDFFGSSYDGMASLMTPVDLTVMRALGYRTAQGVQLGPVNVADTNSVSSGVTFTGHAGMRLTGTVSNPTSQVDVYAGKRYLGEAQVDDQGFWSLDAKLSRGKQGQITAVMTDATGGTSIAEGSFNIKAGLRGQPYAIEEDIHDGADNLTGQTFSHRDGSLYLRDTVTTRPNGDAVFNYSGGSYFEDKPYTEEIKATDATGAVTSQTTYNAFGAESSLSGQSAQDNYAFIMGEGEKAFVFTEHPGQAIVSSFAVSGDAHDTLSLPSSEFASLAAVLHNTHNVGGDAVIAMTPTDSITIQGVTKAQLRTHPGDFSLHG